MIRNVSKTPKLPSRKAMQEISKSGRTINDYSKLTPTNPTEQLSPVVQMLRVPKGR